MVDLTEDEIAAANERGAVEFVTKPHAARARYDRSSGLMTPDLYNGCSFTFPPHQLQGLEAATDDALDQFELIFSGYGLHWDKLDVDFTVPGLLSGSFGTTRFMESHRANLRNIYNRMIENASGLDAQAAE